MSTAPINLIDDGGAIGDGVTDDTASIQASLNLAKATKRPVFVPGAVFKTTSPLTLSSAVEIYGAGPLNSIFRPSPSSDFLSVDSQVGPTLYDFGVSYPTAQQSGFSAIRVASSTGECGFLRAENLRINQAATAVTFERASQWVMDGCTLLDSQFAAIIVRNANNADSGDSTIANCLVFNPSAVGNTSGIVWQSSGGLRIINNKINNFQCGINIGLASGINASDILITGNSIEAVGYPSVDSGIVLQRLGSSGTLVSVLVTGNQLNGWAAGIQVRQDAVGPWLSSLSIAGNVINGSSSACSGIIVNSTTGFSIVKNVLLSNATGSVAIKTGPSASIGVIGTNIKSGSWAANQINSTSTTQISPN